MPPSATDTSRRSSRARLRWSGRPLGSGWPDDRDSFEAYVLHELAPALRPGQIVIADNLSSHKSARAIALLRAQGNDLIFLLPYSPDLNPIEIAFSKLKTLIRKAAARTY